MYLPGDLIPTLLSYMDQETLSIMAQTCKAWKILVYRTSVWSPFTWRPRTLEFFPTILVSPKYARHIGAPNLVCFLNWITQELRYTTDIPSSIMALQEPKKFVRESYKHWHSIKSPCTIVHHHKWSDVCTLKQGLLTLTSDERYTLKVLLVDPRNITTDNGYANWIEHRILDIQAIPTEVSLINTTRSAHVNKLISTVNKQMTERFQIIDALKKKVLFNYETSRRALRSHSRREFETHDLFVQKCSIDLYDAAILSYDNEA